MANVLSMDLRVRFKTLMEDGLCAAAAGKTLLLSRATAARWGKKVRDGEPLEPLPSGPRKGSGKLEPFHPFFVELIAQDPDITLVELQAGRCAFSCAAMTTHIKKGLIAQERGKPEVRKARHDWGRLRMT